MIILFNFHWFGGSRLAYVILDYSSPSYFIKLKINCQNAKCKISKTIIRPTLKIVRYIINRGHSLEKCNLWITYCPLSDIYSVIDHSRMGSGHHRLF